MVKESEADQILRNKALIIDEIESTVSPTDSLALPCLINISTSTSSQLPYTVACVQMACSVLCSAVIGSSLLRYALAGLCPPSANT